MIRLRPVTEGDVPVLERQHAGPEDSGEMGWYGFKPPGTMARRVAAGETITNDRGVLAVVDEDGNVVGDVSWIRSFNGPPPNGDCWNVGIWLVPEARGKGYGSEAQRLLAAHLLDNTFLERIEASTEAGNVAEQKALAAAGFTREGVLRRACFRGGEWRDMVVFSKLRGEP